MRSSLRLLAALPLLCSLSFACGRGREQAPAADASAAEAKADTKAKGKSGKLFDDIASPLEFRDPEPGPRAPDSAAFGAVIGATSYAEIQKLTEARDLHCKDTSVRAMMDAKRAAERKKQEEEGADAVSSASWMNKKSKREKNPQVRFACPKVTSELFTDRERPRSRGRLLYVFDSEELPLRHASYQRSHHNHDAAIADYRDAVAAATAIYGEPTESRGEIPEAGADGKIDFPQGRSLETRWDFSDLTVRVTAIHFGRKVTVGERVEVPHGVRPDAPTMGKPASTKAPALADAAKATPSADPPAPTEGLSKEEQAELEAKRAADAASAAKAGAKAKKPSKG
ncbi:MAG: hypothetical protein KC486_05545 [Myxococcales bacterium]|nr:hypothetical protein [Myxococcales bacterium]